MNRARGRRALAREGGALALVAALATAGTTPPGGAGTHRAWFEVATAQALAGRLEAADSLLVAMLSADPRDAAALNALGNLRMLQGKPGAASAFYREAGRIDPASSGIRINLAGALLEAGRDAEAESVATLAIVDAGGLDSARELLGIRTGAEPDSAARGAAAKRPLSRRDIDQLLARAAARVPAAPAPLPATASPRNTKVMSRPGAPRASAPSDVRPALYWGP